MANITRLTVTSNWTDLETAISGFSANADDVYEIQNIGTKQLQIYGGTQAPTDERDGFVVGLYGIAIWTKVSGQKCFVKSKEDTTVINMAKLEQ